MDLFNDEYIKFDYDGKTYAIEMLYDPMPSNPRVDAVNIVSLMCWHRRYCLGDHHDYKTPHDFLDAMLTRYAQLITEEQKEEMSISEKIAELQKNSDIVMIPLFLYDHSGLALHLGVPGVGCDSFDTSMIGWAVLEKKSFLNIGLAEAEWTREKAEEFIRDEVDVYAQYLAGDVHGYTLYDLEDPNDPQEVDSCWGFFGTDILTNGIADNIPGLTEAIQADKYTTGTVQTVTYTTKKFA